MAHVKISKTTGKPTIVIVDGVEMQDHIYSHGFEIKPGDFEHEASVSMIVAADTLEVDLPDAVIKAIRLSDEEVSARKSDSAS